MRVLVNEEDLAQTYSHPSVADPYDVITQYRRVMQYPDDAGSTRIARELELPRGRIRPWLNGSKPDAVTAVEVARSKGWFNQPWSDPTPALALLCIAVFLCGSIQHQAYVPSWTPSTATAYDKIETALREADIPYRFQPKREARSAELLPQSYGGILGRTLSVIGAPTGEKTAENVTRLPNWLSDAPRDLRRQIAIISVSERGSSYAGKATRRIQTDRPRTYYQDLADLIEGVTDEPVTVSDTGITISASAVRALNIE